MMGGPLYLLLAAVYCSSCISVVDSYRSFVSMIPNGRQVPHPCDVSKVWIGVGHENHAGGGPRNPFGVDFGRHNYVYAAS